MPEDLPHPEPGQMTLDRVLSALANPLRRHVVVTLARAEPGTERQCVSFALPVTAPTRTHHFRVLREAGLIWMLDRGNQVLTSLRRDELDRRFPGLIDAVLASQDSAHQGPLEVAATSG